MLVHIRGEGLCIYEVNEIMGPISTASNVDAIVGFGDTPESNRQDDMQVTVIAAGVEHAAV